MKNLHSALLAAALLAPCPLLADIVNPADYAKSFNIKFSGYAGNTALENFPALVRLSPARNGFDYSKCSDGADLRFVDADGNLIPHEIDTWNPNGESLVWVRVPSLSGRTTVIKAHYGYKGAGQPPAVTASDVWANGYVAVWHMNAPEGTFTQTDSTTTGKNIAPHSSYRDGILCGVEGAVGVAAELGRDGVTTGAFYVSDNGGVLDGFPAVTMEAWTFQTNYASADAYVLMKKVPSPAKVSYLLKEQVSTDGKIAGVCYTESGAYCDAWQSANLGVQCNEWTHQVSRWDGDVGRNTAFINGGIVQDITANSRKGTLRTAGSGSFFYLGNNGADQWGTGVFPGKIDEVRISSVARSDDWVVASHDTIANEDFASCEIDNDWRQYAHKFNISFPGVTEGETLTDFPVLVKISEGSPAGFRYADCLKHNGGDLRFADENGALLSCEVEVWNPEGESLIWVKVPTLTKDTKITGYYGWAFAPAVVSTEVWDENFLAVWHMDAAEGTRSQKDSTVNGKTVTCPSGYANAVSNGVEGILGTAARCGLRSDKLGGFSISDPNSYFDGLGAITMEAWTFKDSETGVPTDVDGAIIYKMRATGSWVYVYSMYESKSSGKIGFWLYKTATTSVWPGGDSHVPSLDEWHYHARRWDGTSGYWASFEDTAKTSGGSTPASPETMLASDGDFCIGNRATNNNGTTPFRGVIDEVRVSKVARSDAWILATHDTIAANATFTTYGPVGDNVGCTIVFFH